MFDRRARRGDYLSLQAGNLPAQTVEAGNMFSKGRKDRERKSRRKGKGPLTIISADLTVTGSLTSDGEVLIDGSVDGDVASARLSVSQNGRIVGMVSAGQALIRGCVDGEIRVQEVTLTGTAQVTGDIHH